MRETEQRFDLVLLDLTDPDTPASALYTASFFASVKNILSPGGAMVLHTGSPIFRPDVVTSIYSGLAKNAAVYSAEAGVSGSVRSSSTKSKR
ncbi:MAG: hypothetical protein ACKO71_09660 [Betaproteobacteria bacterium]